MNKTMYGVASLDACKTKLNINWGSILYIYARVDNEQLKISKSGTSSAWITVKPISGTVAMDLNIAKFPGFYR